MKVFLHSYSFRAYSFEAAVQYARRYGYDGVELSTVHCRDTAFRSDLPRCLKVANRYGIGVACVDYRGNFIADSERDVYESVGLVERNISICGDHGVALMNGFVGVLARDGAPYGANGSALATEAHYERAADALKYLGEAAAKQNILLTIEVHMNTPHDTLAAAKRLVDAVRHESVVINPDPGNMFAVPAAEKTPDALDVIGDRIGYFHFKNCRAVDGKIDYSAGLGDGHIDIFGYVAKLKSLGYAGPVCIEYVGEGDPRPRAKADIGYLRECLQLINDGLS